MAIPVSCEPVRRVGRSGASGAASGTDGTCPGEPPEATSSDRATDRCYADAGWESRSKPQDVGVCRHDDPLHVVNGAPPHPWGPHPPSGGCRPRLASGIPRRLAGCPPGRPQNRCSVSGHPDTFPMWLDRQAIGATRSEAVHPMPSDRHLSNAPRSALVDPQAIGPPRCCPMSSESCRRGARTGTSAISCLERSFGARARLHRRYRTHGFGEIAQVEAVNPGLHPRTNARTATAFAGLTHARGPGAHARPSVTAPRQSAMAGSPTTTSPVVTPVRNRMVMPRMGPP